MLMSPRSHAKQSTALAALVSLACIVAACGSPATDAASGAPSSLASANAAVAGDSSSGTGYGLPDCTGLSVDECSHDGFDPAIDGFSFANWGETGTLDATAMIALFGEASVCAEMTDAGCVLYPAAAQWADQINEAMAGGHCEGMAVMAERLFQGEVSPSDLDPAAQTAADLTREDPDVEGAINIWWASQLLDPVHDAYMATHSMEPSQIAAELARGLQSGKGYTMGIYSPGGAHAITPIAVTREGSKIAVSVYDNNFPGTVQRIMIDPATERWSYAVGSTNPDAPTGGWEGERGTIELTPMGSRVIPAVAPFADPQAKGSSGEVTVLATSPDPNASVDVSVTLDGQTYDTSDPSVALPEGITARPLRDEDVAGETDVERKKKQRAITLRLNAEREAQQMAEETNRRRKALVAASASSQSSSSPGASVSVTVSVDAVGSPRVTVTTESTGAGAKPSTVSVAPNGGVTVEAPSGTKAVVNVANGLNGVSFPLPEGIQMSVDPAKNGAAKVEYKDAGGNVVGKITVDDATKSGSVMTGVAEFDEESGQFEVTEREAEAVEVNTDLVAALSPDADGDSGVAAEPGSQADSGSAAADDASGASGTGSDSGSSAESDSGGAAAPDSGSNSGGASEPDNGSDSGGAAEPESGGSSGSDSGGSDSGGAAAEPDSGGAAAEDPGE